MVARPWAVRDDGVPAVPRASGCLIDRVVWVQWDAVLVETPRMVDPPQVRRLLGGVVACLAFGSESVDPGEVVIAGCDLTEALAARPDEGRQPSDRSPCRGSCRQRHLGSRDHESGPPIKA